MLNNSRKSENHWDLVANKKAGNNHLSTPLLNNDDDDEYSINNSISIENDIEQFKDLNEHIRLKIVDLSNINITLNKLNNKLGGNDDKTDLRMKINDNIKNGTEIFQYISRKFKISQQLNIKINRDNSRRRNNRKIFSLNDRLKKDFQKESDKFQNIMSITLENERKYQVCESYEESRNSNTFDKMIHELDEENPNQHLLQNQKVNELQFKQISELEWNEAMALERERELETIAQSMKQVNEMYRDLATTVELQDEDIETIADQIEAANIHTASGLNQVRKAETHQKSSGKTMKYFLGFILTVAVIVVLIFILKSK